MPAARPPGRTTGATEPIASGRPSALPSQRRNPSPPPVSLEFDLGEGEATSIEPIPVLEFDLAPPEDTAPRAVVPSARPAAPGRLRLPLPADAPGPAAAAASPVAAPQRPPSPPLPPAVGASPAPQPRAAPASVSPPAEADPFEDATPPPSRPRAPGPGLRLPVPETSLPPPAVVRSAAPTAESVQGLGQVLSKLESAPRSAAPAAHRGFVVRVHDEADLAEAPGLNLRELVLLVALALAIVGGVIWKGPSLGVVDPQEKARREAERQLEAATQERQRASAAAKEAALAARKAEEAARAAALQAPVAPMAPAEPTTIDPTPPGPAVEAPGPEAGGAVVDPAPLEPEARARAEPAAVAPPLEGLSPEAATAQERPEASAEAVRSNGFFTIISTPPQALIEVDGQVLGKTPLIRKIDGFQGRGTISLSLRLKGHKSWTGALTPNESGHYHLNAELERQ